MSESLTRSEMTFSGQFNALPDDGAHATLLIKQSSFQTDASEEEMKGADAKASKCHLKYSSKISIFLRLLFMSSFSFRRTFQSACKGFCI